jgi:hypothetical protein
VHAIPVYAPAQFISEAIQRVSVKFVALHVCLVFWGICDMGTFGCDPALDWSQGKGNSDVLGKYTSHEAEIRLHHVCVGVGGGAH